jgi:hypothetical protein
MAEHLDLSWKAVGVLIGGAGFLSALVGSIVTWLLTIKNVESKLAKKEEVDKKIQNCRDGQITLCSKEFKKIGDEMESQGKVLKDHTKLLQKGDSEFTALRLAMSEIFDALKIPGGRKKWLQIREDVLNGRTK